MKYFGKLTLLLIAPLSPAMAHGDNWHMMDWNHGTFWSGGVIMFALILLVLIGIAAYFIINQNKMRQDYRKHEDDAVLDILKQRYAQGEITKQQFDEMKKTLK